MRPFSFALRHYHWLLAAVAVLLALVHYMPASCLQELTSDNVPSHFLFRDVVTLGHPLRDWDWGSHSDIFPDLVLVFLVDFFLRAGIPTLQTFGCILLVAYTAVLAVLYAQCGGRRPAAYGMVMLFFFLLLLSNFGLRHGVDFYNLLCPSVHAGTVICALGCLALSVRTAVKGGGSLWWLAALCFISGYSDDLFIVVFPVPILATLIAVRLLHPGRIRSFLPMMAVIAATCVAAHFLARKFSFMAVDNSSSVQYSRDRFVESWRQLCELARPSAGGYFTLFLALDLLYLVLGAVLLFYVLFKGAAKHLALPLSIVLGFGFCVIGTNWGAEILSGNFNDLYATRHVRLAMLFPVFALLAYLSHLAMGSRPREKLLVTAVSLAICVLAVAFVPEPGPQYLYARRATPIIRDVMRRERIEAGLAQYWSANLLTLFLPDDLALGSVHADGSLQRLMNPLGLYAGWEGSPPPAFRMILMKDLDAGKVRRQYGSPSSIVHMGPGEDIWIYTPEKAIRYSPIFNALTNGPLDEFKMDGDFMVSQGGRIEGTSRVGREGRDQPCFVAFGPYPYLRPVKGRYRVTIRYAYLKPPKIECVYDVICTPGTHDHILDRYPIPYVDGGHREFTREFEITDRNQRGPLSVRVLYPGTGDFSFDSLNITYLGK